MVGKSMLQAEADTLPQSIRALSKQMLSDYYKIKISDFEKEAYDPDGDFLVF